MADTTTVPENLRAKALEKGWPEDLVEQALATGAAVDQIIGYMDQGVTAAQARGFLAAQAGGGPELSEGLKSAAALAEWPEDLIKQALAAGAAESDLINFMTLGVTADQAREFMAQGGPPQLDLSWMQVPTEWNTRAKPTNHGLTLEAINIGRYGEIPDEWPYQTEMPRGAVPIAGVEAMGYSIFQKQEVWSDLCARLYEEAIQRRWRPATDVPWETIEPLPDDVEKAIDQICTHISEKEQMEADVLGRWEPDISYGYHEVKLYLATTIFENARAVEVFRKRALSNGGGLGVQSPGWGFRSVVDSRNFTEMVSIQMVLQDSLTLTQYQYLEKYAKNPAEQYIAAHAMQDKARHVAYGITHLKYVMMQRSDRRDEIMRYLDKGEGMLLQDDRKDPATRAAFGIYFGDGKHNIGEGLEIYNQMRKRAVEQYLARLKWATIERADRLDAGLKAFI
jgi:translation elongation factor EF-1beta